MNNLAFYLSLAFLNSCFCCSKNVRQISWILIVLHHDNISAGKTFFVSCVGDRLCDVLDILAGNCKENVPMLKIFRRLDIFKFCVRNALIKADVVGRVDFAVAHARNAFRCDFVTPDSGTSVKVCCNVLQLHNRDFQFWL